MDEGRMSAAREARRRLARAEAATAEAALAYTSQRRRQEAADPGLGRDGAGVVRARRCASRAGR